jgi:hypothetical protein
MPDSIKFIWKFNLALVIFFLSPSVDGQTWTKIYSVPAKGKSLSTDNLGNAYVIKGDMITKYKDDGTLFRVYSNKRLGSITSADVLNPLKIVLFYRDFSRIVFLDNTVTENGNALNLEDYQLELASLACASFDNGLWIYDPVRYLLVRYNQQLQESVRITNLNQILGYAPQPNFLMEYENILYMNDPEHGILKFDIFGTYLTTIPIKHLEKFQVTDERLIYLRGGNEMNVFGLKTLQSDTLKVPTIDHIDARWWKNRLYLLRKDSLTVFQYQN